MASADVASSSALAAAPNSSTTMSRRIRLVSPEQLSKHAGTETAWVSYQGMIYDCTEFAQDHPGGDDLVLRYAGLDVEDIMNDPSEHSHSDSAFDLLKEQPLIGKLATTDSEKAAIAKAEDDAGMTGKDADIVITDDFVPPDTDVSQDHKKHAFLDLSRPLIMQVWKAKFSKDFYLEQVHAPRHLKEPARLFGPWYLEMFTRTPWYVVPAVWFPITLAFFWKSACQFATPTAGSAASIPAMAAAAWHNATTTLSGSAASGSNAGILAPLSSLPVPGPVQPLVRLLDNNGLASPTPSAFAAAFGCLTIGIVVWTILEYALHRFLFHVDNFLPDHPAFLTLHFLLHGIHHYLPMDRLRLVMPPILFLALSAPFLKLAHFLFPTAAANGIISGAYLMYIGYDMTHYSLHHTKLPEYVRQLKKYHLEHHYKNYEAGFGVTSRFWDWVFGTEL